MKGIELMGQDRKSDVASRKEDSTLQPKILLL